MPIDPPTPWLKQAGRPPSTQRTRPVELRSCRRHGETEFANYSAGKKGFRWSCKRCVAEAVTRRHQKIKRTLVAEAGGRCAVCGYDRCVVSLQFHHVDPSQKEFALSVASGKSLASFRREMEKCVLVCANCHGEIEAGMTPSPPAGAKHGEPWPVASQVPSPEPAPEVRSPAGHQLQLEPP